MPRRALRTTPQVGSDSTSFVSLCCVRCVVVVCGVSLCCVRCVVCCILVLCAGAYYYKGLTSSPSSSGWFWLDLLSILPYDLISLVLPSDTKASGLRLPKLLRLFRLFKIAKVCAPYPSIPSTLKAFMATHYGYSLWLLTMATLPYIPNICL